MKRSSPAARPVTIDPMAMAMIGLAIPMTCISICQMRIGYASPHAMPILVPPMYFFGGAMLWISAIACGFLGKPIEHVVFAVLGSSFFVLGLAFQPTSLLQTFMTDPETSKAATEAFGVYVLCLSFVGWIMLVCSTRLSVFDCLLNVVLPLSLALLGSSFFASARDQLALAAHLTRAAGVFGFLTALLAWYAFSASLFRLAQIPIRLPLGQRTMGEHPADRS